MIVFTLFYFSWIPYYTQNQWRCLVTPVRPGLSWLSTKRGRVTSAICISWPSRWVQTSPALCSSRCVDCLTIFHALIGFKKSMHYLDVLTWIRIVTLNFFFFLHNVNRTCGTMLLIISLRCINNTYWFDRNCHKWPSFSPFFMLQACAGVVSAAVTWETGQVGERKHWLDRWG